MIVLWLMLTIKLHIKTINVDMQIDNEIKIKTQGAKTLLKPVDILMYKLAQNKVNIKIIGMMNFIFSK